MIKSSKKLKCHDISIEGCENTKVSAGNDVQS